MGGRRSSWLNGVGVEWVKIGAAVELKMLKNWSKMGKIEVQSGKYWRFGQNLVLSSLKMVEK